MSFTSTMQVVSLVMWLAAPAAPQTGDLSGRWEFKVDDGTYEERLDLTVSGDQLRGTLAAFKNGYFSRRSTEAGSFRVEGRVKNGSAAARLIDLSDGSARDVEIARRGAYLVLRLPGRVVGYGRPGTPLVQDGEGSSEALALAKAVVGRVYQSSAQTSGRGSFVGGRTRLALCANGEVAYDVSDLATVPGNSPGTTSDMGRSVSRRGQWTVVLYAGAPMVMTRWRGSGSSYSLTAYFDVRPATDGRSAEVDGTRLPVTGSC
jgi:hypothetical protein